MEVAAFKSLFNFQNIPAMRELDDNESDSSKGISKRVIALLKDNDTWVEATKKLPDLLMADIEDSGAKKEIKNSSIKSLDDTIRDISKTSGGHIGKLQLEMDVKEQDVEEFIRRITRAKYDVDGLLLNEESQGLGFSNLIYLHMRLEEFYKSIDKNKVNVFFIEEPESHMHPQMQNVFIRFLKNYYIDKKLQGLITTHSNEIASLEPEYFCSLIELFYKERNGEKRKIELNKSLSDRLYEILFQFKVTPGIDWNGNFDAKRFDYWMKTVKTWSRDNDRYEVAMHTVGSGLSYAELDEDKLPQTAIIEELNRVENEELRRGYYLGIINQRGVHWIDPEGKPELELAEDYENRANIAESRGYSRYADILRVIADEFKREAKRNILEARNGDDE